MISTATAAVNAAPAEAPTASQPASVATASASTTGTKTAETRSASRCTGAFPVCASVTSLAIWASWVSAPTRGGADHEPAAGVHATAGHRVAGPHLERHRLTGQHRGVDRRVPRHDHAVGRYLLPRADHELVADLSRPAGTSISRPSRSTRASFAPSVSSARSAAPARRFALASR